MKRSSNSFLNTQTPENIKVITFLPSKENKNQYTLILSFEKKNRDFTVFWKRKLIPNRNT